MTTFTVTIGDDRTRLRADRGSSATYLVGRAVAKLFGGRCFWFPDSGLGYYYGQVFEALRPTKNNSQRGNSSKTNRVRIRITPDPVTIHMTESEEEREYEREVSHA